MLNYRARHRSRLDIASKTALVSLLLSFILLVVDFVYLPQAQPELPLFYTLDSSTGPLVSKWYLLVIPLLALGFSLINLLIIFKLKTELKELLIRLYAFANLTVIAVLSLALLRIIYVTS